MSINCEKIIGSGEGSAPLLFRFFPPLRIFYSPVPPLAGRLKIARYVSAGAQRALRNKCRVSRKKKSFLAAAGPRAAQRSACWLTLLERRLVRNSLAQAQGPHRASILRARGRHRDFNQFHCSCPPRALLRSTRLAPTVEVFAASCIPD